METLNEQRNARPAQQLPPIIRRERAWWGSSRVWLKAFVCFCARSSAKTKWAITSIRTRRVHFDPQFSSRIQYGETACTNEPLPTVVIWTRVCG